MRLVALWLGAALFPLTLLWSVAGAGIYGSPLSEVTREGIPIILILFVLGGPLGLLPLAILSRWWPGLAGGMLVAGGRCAFVLAVHPWGLGHAAPGLYVDASQVFAGIAFVTMALGAALVVIGRGWRGWLAVLTLVGVSTLVTLAAAARNERRVAYAPFRLLHPVGFLAFAPDGRALLAGLQARRGHAVAQRRAVGAATRARARLRCGHRRRPDGPGHGLLSFRGFAGTQRLQPARARP